MERPDEEFLLKPHAELLESAFQALETAYESGDFELYGRIAEKFVGQFEAFWRFRIQKYAETASKEKPGFLGRYWVTVGKHIEDMFISRELKLGVLLEVDEASTVNLHIFRAEPGGNAWDVIDWEGFPYITIGGVLYSKLKLDTTIDEQVYPRPSKFHLELNGGNIAVFQRTTFRYYPDDEGKTRIYEHTQSVGHTLNK